MTYTPPTKFEQMDEAALRAMISRGEHTAECWAVLKANNERVYAAVAFLAAAKQRFGLPCTPF